MIDYQCMWTPKLYFFHKGHSLLNGMIYIYIVAMRNVMLALSGGHAGRGGVTTYGDNRQLVPSAFPVPGLTLSIIAAHSCSHTSHHTHRYLPVL